MARVLLPRHFVHRSAAIVVFWGSVGVACAEGAGVGPGGHAGQGGRIAGGGRITVVDAGDDVGAPGGRSGNDREGAGGGDEHAEPRANDGRDASDLGDAQGGRDGSRSTDAHGGRIPDSGATCGALRLELLTATLKNPVYATAPPGDSRIFVLERLSGRVVIVDAGGPRAAPFLDLGKKLSTSGFEAGLLSLAFHPRFSQNSAFYVSYTVGTVLRVSRFTVPAGTPDVADPASEAVVIEIPQLSHHNTGGMVQFSPDGLLFVATGDDDSEGNGQDLSTLKSKLLRLDVDPARPDYLIPPGNPFVGVSGVRPEIWAYGLRAPYRFWFDGGSGDLYIADVGDAAREEIDIVPAGSRGGQNFGWPTMEGTLCHTPAVGCNKTGLALPAYEYVHAGEIAFIGGSVYRGTALPACFRGRYWFGAYPDGWLRTLGWSGASVTARDEPQLREPGLVSFGQDGQGELLLLGYDQTVYRLVPRR